MTKGKIKFCVDQGIDDSIDISYGEITNVLIISQGNNKILIHKENIKQFEEAITSMRRWSNSK